MTTLQPHPYADIFPMIFGDEFEQLKADIKANGVQNMGLLFEGKILDGRNRYKACCELGIENQMNWQEVELGEPEEVAKFDPGQYVLSQNLYRRHLTESQRGMVAAALANLKHGGDRGNQHTGGKGPIGPLADSIKEASEKCKVGTTTTKRAKNVIKNGCKELQQLVKDGKLSVSKAEEIANGVKCPKEQMTIAKDFLEAPKGKQKEKAKPGAVKDDNKLEEFKKFWSKCSDMSKAAIRAWLSDN